MNNPSLYILLAFAWVLTSCCTGHLTVQSEFLRREKLASYHVNTPDPALDEPLQGQRLLVSWFIPPSYLSYEQLYLKVVIRFIDRTEMTLYVNVDQLSATYIYTLKDQDFCEKGGFLTYKVDLIGDGCILANWRHQLWTELIKLDTPPSQDT